MADSPDTVERQQQQPNSTSGQAEHRPAQTAPQEPGTAPLDPRAELYVRHRIAGMTQWQAYFKAAPTRVKKATAESRASVLERRPDVAARLAYLAATSNKPVSLMPDKHPAKSGAKSGAATQRPALPNRTQHVAGEEVTPELVKAALVAGLRADKPDASTIKAGIEYLQRRDKALGLDAPSPETVAQWLADDEETRTPDHMRRVLRCIARLYRVDMQALAEACKET